MFPVKIIGEPGSTDREITVAPVDGVGSPTSWHIPEETPVAFVYNRRNYAVMLATPLDIVDYVVGFSLTEGVVDDPGSIESLDISYTDRGVDLRIRIDGTAFERFSMQETRRTLPGNAGCGLCGLENADRLFETLPRVAKTPMVLDAAALTKAMDELAAHQPINQRTRSVHGAAWANLAGDILHLREDVGRHNALDKLLGALALKNIDTGEGFVLMSSRCSYELVEKAARRGVKALVTISGPTGFALAKAKEANMRLYARGVEGAVEIQGKM